MSEKIWAHLSLLHVEVYSLGHLSSYVVIIHQRSDLYQENGKFIFCASYFLALDLFQSKVFNVDFYDVIIHVREFTFKSLLKVIYNA